MEFDPKKVFTLAGTLVLAGAVVVGGIYGPSAWKVLTSKTAADKEPVVMQTPPIESVSASKVATPGIVGQGSNGQGAAPQTGSGQTTAGPSTGQSSAGTSQVTTQVNPTAINTAPKEELSGPKKYKEPDASLMNLAPSIAVFFGEGALSQEAKTIAYGAAWNIHQYVEGYLYGPNGGPQMNEQDIKKYIVFHKTLWDHRLKSESGAAKASAFAGYFDVMLNRGADAFDSKDKVRIEQFHQEIHDMDSHLMRNNAQAKIYGATPFATKR